MLSYAMLCYAVYAFQVCAAAAASEWEAFVYG